MTEKLLQNSTKFCIKLVSGFVSDAFKQEEACFILF